MSSQPTVFIVDDDPAMLKAVARTVESAGWQSSTYVSGQAFLDAYDPAQPGCVILDVRMPRLNGLTVQEKLLECSSIPIIFITGYGEVPTAVQAMQAGAMDFLEKPFSEQVLLARIEDAIANDTQQRRNQSQRDIITSNLSHLTPREREVLDCITAGKLNKEIAEHLDISRRTVENHRQRIMQKMHAVSAVDLARMVFTAQDR